MTNNFNDNLWIVTKLWMCEHVNKELKAIPNCTVSFWRVIASCIFQFRYIMAFARREETWGRRLGILSESNLQITKPIKLWVWVFKSSIEAPWRGRGKERLVLVNMGLVCCCMGCIQFSRRISWNSLFLNPWTCRHSTRVILFLSKTLTRKEEHFEAIYIQIDGWVGSRMPYLKMII
jgi:hypothetical protein